jgi:hypothetical protein
MAHLGQIQEMLNTNPEYRKLFLKDPVAALEEQGLILPVEMHDGIRQMVANAQTPQQTIPGAAAGQFGKSALQTTPLQTVPLQTEPLQTVPFRQIALIIAFE